MEMSFSNINLTIKADRFKITKAKLNPNTKVLSASFKRDKTTINELVNELTLNECNAKTHKNKVEIALIVTLKEFSQLIG